MGKRRRPYQELFFEQIDFKHGRCWHWKASTNTGYGQFWMVERPSAKQKVYAHRLAYELFKGPISDGLRVRHNCDNRRCVNPEHLFLGPKATYPIASTLHGRYEWLEHSQAR